MNTAISAELRHVPENWPGDYNAWMYDIIRRHKEPAKTKSIFDQVADSLRNPVITEIVTKDNIQAWQRMREIQEQTPEYEDRAFEVVENICNEN